MIYYERLGYLDIINTYEDAIIQWGGHNAQNSNSMASMSFNSQYHFAEESFEQFLDHNIIVKSYVIDFNTFGAVIWLLRALFESKLGPKIIF